jgi:transposase-like protein
VIDMAVLIAIGVSSDGKRQVLGVSVSLSEQEVHWRHFLQSLFARGLHGVLSITSDAHMGIRAALASVCPGIPWQRCQFHLQQNAQKYVPKQDLKEAAALAIRNIFNAPDKDMAEKLLKTTIDVWAEKAPKLSAWMEENIPEGFTVFCFSEGLRKKLRTSNPLERVNQEIKRRTRVARIFPNEISEDWETGKPYLKL